MSLFGNFKEDAFSYKTSKKEDSVQASEDWSSSILAGSNGGGQLEEPLSSVWLRYFIAVIGVAALVLSFKLFDIQVVNGQRHRLTANGNRIRQKVIRAPRGAIYDSNHTVLTRNVANFDLVVIPAQLSSKPEERTIAYQEVGKLVDQTADEAKKKAEASGLDYAQPILITDKIDRDKALSLDEKARQTIGFVVDINPSREYLDGGLLSHFLGYIGRISAEEVKSHPDYQPTDYIGKNGLEKAYERDLKGQDGSEQVEVDASGHQVRSLASADARPGNSLVLSVDSALEKKMAEFLKAEIDHAGSSRGVAIAMDPSSGQVLGAVNFPSYDNNLFAKGISQDDYQKLLNDPNKPLFNKATAGGYPVGSTIKPIVSAAALQEGVVNGSTTVVDKGKLDVPNQYNPSIVYTFKGWKPEGLGVVNVVRALTWSSDIFYYMVGGGFEQFRGLGITKLLNYYYKFGFGRKTGIDIADESAGAVPNPDSKKARTGEGWFVGDTYNLSIGQGDLRSTPLQLLVATSAIANGGTIYKPHLAKAVVSPDGEMVREIKPEATAKDIIKPEYLKIVQQGMRGAVEEGTACCKFKGEVPVAVAGKTGTAETSSEGFDGKNPRTKPHAWFTAYAPADNPKIAVVVLVENSGEGAEFAVPVARNILKWYFGGRPN